MSRDYRAKRQAKEQDTLYAEALRRLREWAHVDWPTHEVQLHEHLEVAGFTGEAESEGDLA